MDSIIETQRQTHEELERYEAALAEVLIQNPTVVSQSALVPRANPDLAAKKHYPS
jgi:splicing factor 3A subunit 3